METEEAERAEDIRTAPRIRPHRGDTPRPRRLRDQGTARQRRVARTRRIQAARRAVRAFRRWLDTHYR